MAYLMAAFKYHLQSFMPAIHSIPQDLAHIPRLVCVFYFLFCCTCVHRVPYTDIYTHSDNQLSFVKINLKSRIK